MKHLSFLYDAKKSYKAAKQETQKPKYTAILIQLFSGTTKKKLIKQKLSALKKDFPNAIIIGTTTAGEISNAKMYERETVVSLSLFNNTKLSVYRTKDISTKSGKELSSKITNKETKAAIILSEGLKGSDYEGFIKGIKKENPHVILAGGLAGDNFALKKTYIFMDDTIYDSGAVGVSFSGKNLRASNEYNLNWNPIGKKFTITKVEGNILLEIDNKNAIELMKHYLGKSLFENECASLPDFPLLYKEGNTVVSRTPMTIDKDKIVLAGPIKEGQKIQFGFSNATSIISGANSITRKLNQNPAEAIYIYSCIARKTLLGKKLESEFASFEQLAPTSGFFTSGINDSLNKPIIPQELDAILTKYLTPVSTTESTKLYDTLDIEKISSAINIADKNVIMTLVKSFASSLVGIKKSIEKEGVTGEILHNLKGMVGNLRFSEFQKFIVHAETEYEEWDENTQKKQTQELLKHIEEILKQIDTL